MEKKPIYLSPGTISKMFAACQFAVEQHSALAALSTGDERALHLDQAAGAQRAADALKQINGDTRAYGYGAWEVSWCSGKEPDL